MVCFWCSFFFRFLSLKRLLPKIVWSSAAVCFVFLRCVLFFWRPFVSFFLETFWEAKNKKTSITSLFFFLLYYFLLKQLLMYRKGHHNHVSQSLSRNFGESLARSVRNAISGNAELDARCEDKISTKIITKNSWEKNIFFFSCVWSKERNLWWFQGYVNANLFQQKFIPHIRVSQHRDSKSGRSLRSII